MRLRQFMNCLNNTNKMKTIKHIAPLVLSMIIALGLQGQTTGYQGKRMMFKTDIISPITERGVQTGLEYVLLRNLVLGVDFTLTGQQYTQRLEDYRQQYGDYPAVKARIRDSQAGITVQYFINNALPAPTGSYVFGKYAIGRATIFGNEYIQDPISPENDELRGYKLENIPSRQFDLGIGYQEVVYGFLLLDFDIAISAASLLLDKADNANSSYNNLIDNFATSHGPNIYSLGSWRNQVDADGNASSTGGIGFSIHFKVGILLF